MTLTLRLALWAALAGVMVVPLAMVVSLGLGANHLPELIEEGLGQATVNSLVSSLLSAIGAVIIGTIMAFLLDRTDLPGRGALRLLLLTPLFIPPFIGAIAWSGLLTDGGLLDRVFGVAPWNFYGGPGVVFLLTLHAYPMAYFVVTAALRRIPAEFEEASRLSGSTALRTHLDVTMPLIRPAMAAAFTLTFVSGIGDFGIPVIVGLPAGYETLSTLVYRMLESGSVVSPLQTVSQIGIVLLLLGVLGTLLDRQVSKGGVEFGGTGRVAEPQELGRARRPLGVAAWVVSVVVTAAPLVGLLVRALLPAPGVPLTLDTATLDNFRRALTAPTTVDGIVNSVFLALGAALICGVIGLLVGLFTTRLANRDREPMLLSVLLPQAVPGLVIATGWLILGRYTGLFNTRWVILGAYVTAFTAIVVQTVRGPLAGIHSSMEEAARIGGAGALRSRMDTSVRLALPAAGIGMVMVALTAVRELTLSVLLVAPGTQTLGVVIFQYQRAGDYNASSALSVALMAVGLLALALFGARFAGTSTGLSAASTASTRASTRATPRGSSSTDGAPSSGPVIDAAPDPISNDTGSNRA
ncbi:iron ABC transporter permease [Dietzia sp. NCCP-2495]|uniref:ABC transporter permease n=1 Tax=Dietzia sp. NCCP-2495 TaxID=2934675 RepID=UPI0022325295|nr:iron ABC transporter permease [Dietzia sp. NCCP-2495]GLB64848.1 iron ABC transporter permease [Dietzia sp. NCCP-2495]